MLLPDSDELFLEFLLLADLLYKFSAVEGCPETDCVTSMELQFASFCYGRYSGTDFSDRSQSAKGYVDVTVEDLSEREEWRDRKLV